MSRVTSSKIVSETEVGPNPTQYYGTLVTKNISYDDGTDVAIEKFLGVTFKSPPVSNKITVNVQLSNWQIITPEISTEEIDPKTIKVTAKLSFEKSYTFTGSESLTWQINGSLLENADTYTNSFELYADFLPNGTVNIECAKAPDQALGDSTQIVYLKQDDQTTSLTVTPGKTESHDVVVGNYTVEAAELTDLDELTVAVAQASPNQIAVKSGEEVDINVTYGTVQKYSALDVSIGSLLSPIDKEHIHVEVVENSTGDLLADFLSPNNHKETLRRLPEEGKVDINAQITLNNLKYTASQTANLANNLTKVLIEQNDIKTEEIDTSGFVSLPIKLQTDLGNTSATISLRLSSTNNELIYTQVVNVSESSTKFDVPVAPGDYAVKATGFFDGTTVYAIKAPADLSVASDGSTKLELATQCGADLNVTGFPDFLSFGALSDLVDLEGDDFVAANASSVFKYAGFDGAGDANQNLSDDTSTTKTVELANKVAERLGRPFLPVLVSYTVNLSLGDTYTHLQDKDGLAHSFGNLILSLGLAQKTSKQPVPAGYIVNPDFLGECQKGPEGTGIPATYPMPVREPLEEALKYRDIHVDVPGDITDTLKGYALAVNWLIRTVASGVPFGWQVNLWGVGKSEWIYSEPSTASVADIAKETADYIKTLEVYSGKYRPDFLAIDRFEADDFTQRAYVNSYCYGPYEWGRYYDFCSQLSLELQVPVMPWQIPASRIPLSTETVTDLETECWGSGGTYIFGDPGVGSDYHNINRKILAITPGPLVPHPNVEDIFASAQPFDLTNPAYEDFPLRGIFTVLLGGGVATGIVKTIGKTGPWTQEKIRAYMEDPIPLYESSSS
ncbi:putative hydroxymethyltransferase [Jackrogersella minutella]|nr:putative hydroxymethyltransferase [Jackrogersella minutella]